MNVEVGRVVVNAVSVSDRVVGIETLVEPSHNLLHRRMKDLIWIDATLSQCIVRLLDIEKEAARLELRSGGSRIMSLVERAPRWNRSRYLCLGV